MVWDAQIGGAETLMRALAQRFSRLGAEAEVVIIGGDGPLADRLREAGTPFRTLGVAPGRKVLRHPRDLAQAVLHSGPDGALLTECGYLGACLRLGGYDRPIVAVEHGSVLFPGATLPRRMLDRLSRAGGAWADDVEVAVSDLVLARMRPHPHARQLRRIYNGIDPEAFAPRPPRQPKAPGGLVVGFVGRLAAGKGLDVLIAAIAQARKQVSVNLLVAGDGPERAELAVLAQSSSAAADVDFLGMIDDVQEFWQRCDIAIVPSNAFIESFCLAALEAMACGKPLIATRNGALPELVRDGTTGTLVAPGDVDALARAIVMYAREPSLRQAHAVAARAWAVEHFDLDDCARAYLDLFAGFDRVAR